MGAVKERMNLYNTKSVMDELRRAIPARERTKMPELSILQADDQGKLTLYKTV